MLWGLSRKHARQSRYPTNVSQINHHTEIKCPSHGTEAHAKQVSETQNWGGAFVTILTQLLVARWTELFLIQSHQNFLLSFFLIFIGIIFIIWPYNQIWDNLCAKCEVWIEAISSFIYIDRQRIYYPSLKRPFLVFYPFYKLAKKQAAVSVKLHFCSTGLCTPLPTSHNLTCLQIIYWESSHSILPFQNSFASSCSFVFSYEFQKQFV